MKLPEIIEPSACRHCDIPKRRHCQQWHPIAKWHIWKMPYQWQIKDRMKARRNATTERT